MNNRNHPVRQLLDAAAHGHLPTDADLDALPIDDATVRHKVEKAAREAVELKRDGFNGRAANLAHNTATDVIGSLPPWEPTVDVPTNPEDIVKLVPRRGW